MGLAAAATSMAFAQEPQDFTRKLWNADFEKGPHGWDITGESSDQNYNVWMPQVKGDAKAPGYHGHNNLALEIWTSGALIKNNSVSQTVTDLPDGTYVFGAYMMATNQSNTPNREEIVGVYLFANEDLVPVATNKVEGIDSIWGHAAKFNVAVEVTDGTLKVGAKCENANINFTTIDNTTLWYFGNMDKDAALDKMAQIDMAASLAIADTCAALMADTETKAYLEEKMQAARELTSDEDAYTVDEELWWGMRQVRKSAKAYEKLAGALAEAEAFSGLDWDTSMDETAAAKEALDSVIAEYKGCYEEGSVAPADVDSLINVVAEAQAVLGLENVYILLEVYEERIDSISELEGDEVGQYYPDMIDNAEELWSLIHDELALLSEGVSAIEIKANCEAIYAKIQNIIDNPINYYEFPIFLHRSDELLPNQGEGRSNQAYPVLEGAYVKDYPAGKYGGNNVATYDSPLFRFREPLTKVRFIVHEVGADFQTAQDGRASFCLAEFSMYDENDNPIELTTENLVTNANEPKEGSGIPALIDGDYCTNFFHSLWSGSTPQAHYLEVTLPEGEYSAFRFTMVSLSRNHTRAFPAEMEITYVSDEITELQQAIVKAREKNPLFGTAPGFCDIDPVYYENVLAEGDAVVEKPGVSDSEIQAAIDKVNALVAQIDEAGIKLPEAGKNYRIVSGEPRFFTNQNIVKTLTVHTDTTYGDWLWWETAHPDSAQQEFTLEFLENKDDKLYYAIKNTKLDRYLSELLDSAGNVIPNRFVFSERRDSFVLRSLGQGQFGIIAEGNSRGQLNMEFHNNGVASDQVRDHGAIMGVTSYIHTWGSNANQSSAWFFREMATLPHAVKSISDLNFRTEAVSLYEGINIVTLTADKECAFADLKVYNTFNQEVAIDEVTVDGKVATIKLVSNIETLAFSFNNTEGVTEVELNGINEYRGEIPELTELRNSYNTASNKLVVYGTEVGQVADYKEFDDAMVNAEYLLENGGETEALVAAKAAVDSAVAHLVYNLPVAGKEYFIQSALPWMTRWNSEMDVYVKADGIVYWGYVNIKDMNHRWKFVDCGMEKNGMPAYYLENVGTGSYLTTPRSETNRNDEGRLFVVEDTTEAAPFNIHFLTDGKVAIADSREGNAEGNWSLHPMNHQRGTGYVAHGYMISHIKTDVASEMRIVSADKIITDFMTGIEDVEIAGEQSAPAVKGIYDLFGRRIETPAATGIYIVDGKKQVVKR